MKKMALLVSALVATSPQIASAQSQRGCITGEQLRNMSITERQLRAENGEFQMCGSESSSRGSGSITSLPPMPKGHVPGRSKPEPSYPREIFTPFEDGSRFKGSLNEKAYGARSVVIIGGVRY